MTNKRYDSDSIGALVGAERVRQRPAAMLGSNGLKGAQHGVTEILGNAIDEASAGYGGKIDLYYHADNSITIRDYGRGVPMQGTNTILGIPTYEAIFNELYSGGKYETYQEELAHIQDNNLWGTFDPTHFNYLFSIGLNGLGAAATQYSSAFFHVISYRDGEATSMRFKNGYKEWDKLLIEPTDEPNGTYIHWRPDAEVFTATDVTGEYLHSLAKTTAYISGLTTHFINEKTSEDITYQAGTVEDYLKQEHTLTPDTQNFVLNNTTHGAFTVADEAKNKKRYIYVFKYSIALAFVEKGGNVDVFHNAVEMTGDVTESAHHKGVHAAIDTFFLARSREAGVKLNQYDYRAKMAVVVSGYSNIADYANQTKDIVSNEFIRNDLNVELSNMLRIEWSKGNPQLVALVEELLEDARIKAEIEEQRKQARKLQRTTSKRVKVDKFKPSKFYRKNIVGGSEFWMMEGDSAAGAVTKARDSDFQAILALKGKIINVLKHPIERVLANVEVTNIFSLLGAGMEIPLLEQTFDIEKMKFDKIIIGTDADDDGYQIRVLLFLLFYKFAPSMIEEGRLYIAESPLYNMVYSDTIRYAYNREQRIEIEKEYGRPNDITRNKGLGEVDADVLAKTTVDPAYTKHKNLVQIKLDTKNLELASLIDALYGKDVARERKNIIVSYLGTDIAEMLEDNASFLDYLEDVEYTDELDLRTVEV